MPDRNAGYHTESSTGSGNSAFIEPKFTTIVDETLGVACHDGYIHLRMLEPHRKQMDHSFFEAFRNIFLVFATKVT